MKKIAIVLTLCASFGFGIFQTQSHYVENAGQNDVKAEKSQAGIINPVLKPSIIYPDL